MSPDEILDRITGDAPLAGPVIEAGLAPGGGTEDFAWMIWSHGHKGPPTLGWLNRDSLWSANKAE